MGKIAVVVADPQERSMIAAAARSVGHDVLERDHARRALDEILPADVLIVGVDLPDGNGLDLVARLRLLDARPLPVILVSSDPADATRGRSVGAQHHALRPLDPERVRSLLLRAQQRPDPIGLDLPRTDGLVFGRYSLHRLLGRGSYGGVYEAWDAVRCAPVALKVLDPATENADENLARFVRESKLLSGARFPHVVSMLDAGLVDGRAFCSMRLVRGPTLDFRVLSEGPLTERQGLGLLWGLLRALHGLAGAGIVHRDVTPRNVILEASRVTQPVLIDFGLAKPTQDHGLTAGDVILGTPGYIAPEIVQGADADVRGDMFSAGLVVLYALEGRHPFDPLRGMPLLRAMAESPVALPERLSPGTRSLLAQLTAVDPAARFARPADALVALGRLASECATRGAAHSVA